MFIFSYSETWADLMVMQLESSLGGPPETWGYACLCIGRELDEWLEENYEAADQLFGQHLHVFSMRPPPWAFVQNRIARAEGKGNQTLAQVLRQSSRGPADNGQAVREKVRLLQDLASSGLAPDKRADFLFFDFRLADQETSIDVIAAKVAPTLGDAASIHELFSNLARAAKLSAARGQTAEEFVKSATWQWNLHVALRRTMDLGGYIAAVIARFRGRTA